MKSENNLQLVYWYILSLSQNERMFYEKYKKNKKNKNTKGPKKKLIKSSIEPRTYGV